MAATHKSKLNGRTYSLCLREHTLGGGKKVKLYYWSNKSGKGTVEEIPPGYVVEELQTGLPILKKVGETGDK